ncbi:hypothetical protein LTR95_013779 [Oleoguttula sp. CCFEE 5521]
MYIELPIGYAWEGQCFIRNGIGPPQSALLEGGSMTADVMVGSAVGGSVHALVIGEFKRPGVINLREWLAGAVDLSLNTRRLQQELWGYAHHYNCYYAFAYDGQYLLIVRFQAMTQPEIRRCKTRHWLIPYDAQAPQVTARRAFYSLVRCAWQRDVGTRVGDSGIFSLGDWTFRRNALTGRVFWSSNVDRRPEHPDVSRSLDEDERKWVWADDEGGVVRHEEHHAI